MLHFWAEKCATRIKIEASHQQTWTQLFVISVCIVLTILIYKTFICISPKVKLGINQMTEE